MKNISLFVFSISLAFAAGSAVAQSISVKDLAADEEGSTTIEVRKGEVNRTRFEVISQTEDIQGDIEILEKDAQKSWKQACTEWKQEVKDLNKDNSVLQLSCGSMSCEKSNMQYVCKSKATAKIKTKMAN